MATTLGVLITSHNRKEKTLTCLEALFRAAISVNLFMQVFLVDDASTDGTPEAVSIKFPQIKVVQGNGQLFWNRGMHLAWITAAQHDYDFYLWLNDDTNLFKSALDILFACSALTGNFSIIAGSTCSYEDKQTTYSGWSRKKGLLQPNGVLQQCDYFNGNCVLISKAVYETLGTLDPVFQHSMGDLDYGLRAGKKNIFSYTSPEHVGYCEKHSSPPLWWRKDQPFMARLRNLYSPLGYSQPNEYFIYARRHYGILIAIKHFVSMHLLLIFPSLRGRYRF